MSELHEERPSLEDMVEASVVLQFRTYDVLIAILHNLDPNLANKILEDHSNQNYIGSIWVNRDEQTGSSEEVS